MPEGRRKHSPAFKARCAGGAEGPGDGGPAGRPVRSPSRTDARPEEKALSEDASSVFGNGREQKDRNDAVLIARLYQETRQLEVERDF